MKSPEQIITSTQQSTPQQDSQSQINTSIQHTSSSSKKRSTQTKKNEILIYFFKNKDAENKILPAKFYNRTLAGVSYSYIWSRYIPLLKNDGFIEVQKESSQKNIILITAKGINEAKILIETQSSNNQTNDLSFSNDLSPSKKEEKQTSKKKRKDPPSLTETKELEPKKKQQSVNPIKQNEILIYMFQNKDTENKFRLARLKNTAVAGISYGHIHTHYISHLENCGFIELQKDKKNKTKKIILLTEKGIKEAETLIEAQTSKDTASALLTLSGPFSFTANIAKKTNVPAKTASEEIQDNTSTTLSN